MSIIEGNEMVLTGCGSSDQLADLPKVLVVDCALVVLAAE